MESVTEDIIAQKVRWAGERTLRIRTRVWVGGAVAVLAAFAGAAFVCLNSEYLALWLCTLAALPLAAAIACFSAFLYRRRLCGHLRRELAALPREEVVAALLPLRHETGDTGSVTALLFRSLGAEVAPAQALEGRGAEPVPAHRGEA